MSGKSTTQKIRRIANNKTDHFPSCGHDILLCIASFTIPCYLLVLTTTCRYWHKVLTTVRARKIWVQAWLTHKLQLEIEPQFARRALCLLIEKGCELCGKTKIRKVTWEFRRRICEQCLFAHTISNYRLEGHLIKIEELKSIPFMKKKLWNSRVGQYTLNFYWRPQVEKLLGASLDEIFEERQKRRQEAQDIVLRKAQNQTNLVAALKSCPTTKPCVSFMKYLVKCREFQNLDPSRDPERPWSVEELQRFVDSIRNRYLSFKSKQKKTKARS